MRVAVTYENEEIFQHFGRTAQFKLYDVENNEITSTEVVDTNGNGHGALTGILSAMKVDVLICGNIGGGAQVSIEQAGIKLCGGVCGSADKAVEDLLADKLEANLEKHCDQHGRHHGGGHHCGENKHGCAGNEGKSHCGKGGHCGDGKHGPAESGEGHHHNHHHGHHHDHHGEGHGCRKTSTAVQEVEEEINE